MADKVNTILAIETSCDETAAAVLAWKKNSINVLSQAVASQIDIHTLTGGVVPEIAAREHAAVIQPMIKKVLGESDLKPTDLDAIAVTVGPGLVPALSVGVAAAQTLAYAWDKPIVPVHHLEGHIMSALLAPASNAQSLPPRRDPATAGQNPNVFQISHATELFPALALIVSGGHTMLILVKDHLHYQIIGTTRDDAAGEAFDKVARMLNLPYPGGPHLSKLAATGNSQHFQLSRPMQNSGDLDFSYSGLKTEVLYILRRDYPPDKRGEGGYNIPRQVKRDLAASFQLAVVESLGIKVSQAIKQTNPATLLLSGGVAANQALRQHLTQIAAKNNLAFKMSPLNLCGDNAVMIGLVGLIALSNRRLKKWSEIDASARLNLATFSVV